MKRKSRRNQKRKNRLRLIFMLLFFIYIGLIGHTEFNRRNVVNTYHRLFQVEAVNRTEEAWSLVLVNKWNPILKQPKMELTEVGKGQFVDERIYPYLQAMFDDARKKGIYPIVASGYRTQEAQQSIYNEKISVFKAQGLSSKEAKKEAELWVAIPGTSEHELGIAVDINADGIYSKGSDVYDWLAKNAHRYGFIQRYPAKKTDITGVSQEPWHYRYVGEKVATEIYNQNICLEEYISYMNKDNG
ncbi:M15 family metallopeptidase [Anaerotignum propionicum]|uniref:M15 family metallopeptidase n=1 Tax=Anaerotignum propionicum TaxID=28446 RepID=UPI002FE6F1BA